MKTKRAKDLIEFTQYTESTHPAICALVDFAAQNPGLEFANYGEVSSYRSESRSISKDWHRFSEVLREASYLGLTDANIIEASKGAFSGRLTWTDYTTNGSKEPCADCGAKPGILHSRHCKGGLHVPCGSWSYCTGQYFPTEYRKAAASVLECAIHAHKASRQPASREVFTIADLRTLNEENGGCWFEKSTMRFFGTRIESGILTGHFFVTSEQPPHGARAYTVRTFDDKGSVSTHGELCGYATKAQALKAAQAAHEQKVQVAA